MTTVLLVVAYIAFHVWLYRRDSRELREKLRESDEAILWCKMQRARMDRRKKEKP